MIATVGLLTDVTSPAVVLVSNMKRVRQSGSVVTHLPTGLRKLEVQLSVEVLALKSIPQISLEDWILGGIIASAVSLSSTVTSELK